MGCWYHIGHACNLLSSTSTRSSCSIALFIYSHYLTNQVVFNVLFNGLVSCLLIDDHSCLVRCSRLKLHPLPLQIDSGQLRLDKLSRRNRGVKVGGWALGEVSEGLEDGVRGNVTKHLRETNVH
jgi:hypothetical protein